jgi:hypothetical protein
MSKKIKGNAEFHEKGIGRVMIELAKTYHPKNAIREFFTNSVDADPSDIGAILYPAQRKIIISDDGEGIPFDKLSNLPREVGYSEKVGKIDKRGEKALGLLSFGSLGKRMHIISAPQENNQGNSYGYLMWEMNEQKSKMPFQAELIDPQQVSRYFFGPFAHGTRVIIEDVGENIMNLLTVQNLEKWLRETYAPALINGNVRMNVGKIDKRGSIKLTPIFAPDYERGLSEEIFNQVLRVPIKNEEEPGELEILLYINPEGMSEHVGVYSKDVLVYQSLAELDEFKKSPVWTSGKVTGYINDFFNKLILGRDGIDRNRRAFRAWREKVKEIEEQLRPLVEQKKKQSKSLKEQRSIKEVVEAFNSILKDYKKLNEDEALTRSDYGEELPVEGIEPTKRRKRGSRKKPTKRRHKGRPPGPGTFKYSEDGILERVTSKTNVPYGYPQPMEFPLEEADLRSKLEYRLGKPIMFINSSHEDYKDRVDHTKDFQRYITELMAKESANYEIKELDRKGELLEDKVGAVHRALEEAEKVKFHVLNKLKIR